MQLRAYPLLHVLQFSFCPSNYSEGVGHNWNHIGIYCLHYVFTLNFLSHPISVNHFFRLSSIVWVHYAAFIQAKRHPNVNKVYFHYLQKLIKFFPGDAVQLNVIHVKQVSDIVDSLSLIHI